MKRRAYLSLGSNLGDRAGNLDRAVALLQDNVGAPIRCSSYIVTEPWGFSSNNSFLNAVAIFETKLTAEQLLQTTQSIERQLGRTVKSHAGHYADRLIDIDILFLGDLIISTPELTVPHPLIAQRDFVLRPLAEVAPRKIHPILRKTAAALMAAYAPNPEESTPATSPR